MKRSILAVGLAATALGASVALAGPAEALTDTLYYQCRLDKRHVAYSSVEVRGTEIIYASYGTSNPFKADLVVWKNHKLPMFSRGSAPHDWKTVEPAFKMTPNYTAKDVKFVFVVSGRGTTCKDSKPT